MQSGGAGHWRIRSHWLVEAGAPGKVLAVAAGSGLPIGPPKEIDGETTRLIAQVARLFISKGG